MRIIAGKHKGLKLETFEVGNIRPTLDRAREGIFNKIQFDVPNSECLDLFGGTGAISLELLSRGASKVTIVDVSFDSCKLIQKNFEKAKESLNLIKMDYMQALEFLKKDRFDMIFLDPPFASDYAQNAIIKIMHEKMLKDEAVKKLKLIHYEEVNDVCRNGNFLRQHERAGTSEERMLQEREDRMLRQEGQERMQEGLQERLQAGLRQS